MKIFKYSLEISDKSEIEMPTGAKVLTVQSQGTNVCLWALIDETAAAETRTFYVFGTGYLLNEDLKGSLKYIGTFQQAGGAFIGHVFELRK